MKKLLQISSMVTSNSGPDLNLIKTNGNSKLQKLLIGLVRGKYKNDQEAAKSLYQTSSKSKTYLKLKSRLKERLLDKFFVMDSEKVMHSRYDKAFYQCIRNVFAAQVMILKDMRMNAIELLRSTLQQTQHYHFTELSLTIVRLLRYDAAMKGDKDKLTHYDRLIRQFSQLQQAELLAEKYSQMVVVEFAQKTPSDKQIRKKAFSCYRKIFELSLKHKSRTIELNKFKTGARYYSIAGEHHKAISVCNQCEKYLHDHPQLIQNVRLAEMALFKMDSCLALRDEKNGLQYALQCEAYFNPGTMNWLIFREYDFLLSMHIGNFSRALQLFYEVTGHAKFSQQSPERLEKWKIFEAYLNYALPAQLPKKNFNLFKFLNEISIYSKDKKGYNFAILVAEIILLIETDDLDKLINIAEPFRVYVARYVSRKNNLRSYYFAKLLLVLFKYQFDPVKAALIGKKFLERLNQITPQYKGDLESVEVIPYDKLWELLLKKLKEKDNQPGNEKKLTGEFMMNA